MGIFSYFGLASESADRVYEAEILEDAPGRTLAPQGYMTTEQGFQLAHEAALASLNLAYEDRGWIKVGGGRADFTGHNLSYKAISQASEAARALVIGNPLLASAVRAQIGYVWPKGVRINGADAITLKNKRNRRNVFNTAAKARLETAKATDGNVFFRISGWNISTIPFYRIDEMSVYDPIDTSFIQYYLHVNSRRTMNEQGVVVDKPYKEYIPNMLYERGGISHPDYINGIPVDKTSVIYHVAPNALDGSAWGLPDVLSGIFYAGEHKELIEAGDAVWRAQSQFAITVKAKTNKQLQDIAAHVVDTPVDERTGQPAEYGRTIGYGQDVDMQLMKSIGSGIDFKGFDPIAGLAIIGLRIPINVVLGTENSDDSIPKATKTTMEGHQSLWSDAFTDIFDYMGKPSVKIFFPKLDPDPTHRQVQSVIGAAATKVISPEQTYELLKETFGADWKGALPDPSLWDDYAVQKPAPGSTEPSGGAITPGQGQTGQMGKLADGDHAARDAGEQDHYTPKAK